MNPELKARHLADLRHALAALAGHKHEHAGGVHPANEQEQLRSRVYSLYTRSSQQGKALRAVRDVAGLKRFQALISNANNSRWSWTPDCRLIEAKGDFVVISPPDGAQRTVPAVTFDGPNHEGRGRLLVRPEAVDDQPAWHFVFGEDGINSKQDPIVRLYWDICAEAAPLLVHTLTTQLNRNKVPFHFKTLKDPASYGRADSAVLYLPAYVWDRTAPVIHDIHAVLARYLRADVPCFTKPLARGLGLAEDPGGGESFGMTWARRLVERWEDERSLDENVSRMALKFEHQGNGPGRMHLKPETTRDYELRPKKTEKAVVA